MVAIFSGKPNMTLPSTNSAAARDAAFVFHPHSNLKAQAETPPIIMTGGSGVYIRDDQGNSYLESAASLGQCSLGFSNERLAKAAYEAISTLGSIHSFRNISNPYLIDLSEKLLSIAPTPMARVMFQSSGSEANDTAVKLTWYYWAAMGKPQKRKIISRDGSYHGNTIITTALNGNPATHLGCGFNFPELLKTDVTNYYRHGKPGETEEQFSQRLVDSLEDLILREDPETIGAFLADITQANSGGLLPPAGYWEKIQALLKKYDILLIADEVVTGFGRTGQRWACEVYGVTPDMVSTAKALAAGFQPISALMLNERVWNVVRDESAKYGGFWHGYTWAGHPVACAVALETIKLYEDEDILGHIQEIAPFFQEQVAALADHPLVGNYQGIGLIGGIDLTDDREKRTVFGPESQLGARLTKAGIRNGLFMRLMGNARIHFSPPFIIEKDDIVEMVTRARRAMDEVNAELRADA
ncbi:aminotransferase [Novosphingobium album (ex Liu et al. 2023)]|uniref:Aminotransferase n=1 Tax=Novosphingobium album (ex Liu et al. 2023) TaxID=3031130 RepID=A0ABT5WRU8_9SPHN|nr:aminotransferase [Novosphingobium album (ex Liu et al. 2023)]MDE8652757.1 aminotransferase [Novosphingobium album (ex Liu et al. 2023)]